MQMARDVCVSAARAIKRVQSASKRVGGPSRGRILADDRFVHPPACRLVDQEGGNGQGGLPVFGPRVGQLLEDFSVRGPVSKLPNQLDRELGECLVGLELALPPKRARQVASSSSSGSGVASGGAIGRPA